VLERRAKDESGTTDRRRDPDLQRSVLDQVRSPRFVACDTMNFWIAGKREAVRETLREVDILLINDEEARQLAGETNTVRAARKILGWGPSSLVVKRGEYGAALYSNHSHFAVPAYPLLDPVDPTGAGDSFAGGFVGHLARTGRTDEKAFRQALITGSSGVGPITHFDPTPFETKFAAEVKGFDAVALFGRKDARRMDRFAQFAVAAAGQALADAHLSVTPENAPRIGCIFGSGSHVLGHHCALLCLGHGLLCPQLITVGRLVTTADWRR